MTANKLADDLDNANGFQYVAQLGLASQAATMLRQQQAEIEKLRKIVEDTIGQAFYEDDYRKAQAEIEALKKELALQKLSDIGQAIEQEPVAWMHTNSKQLFATTKPSKRDLHLFTPLYTHPINTFCAYTHKDVHNS